MTQLKKMAFLFSGLFLSISQVAFGRTWQNWAGSISCGNVQASGTTYEVSPIFRRDGNQLWIRLINFRTFSSDEIHVSLCDDSSCTLENCVDQKIAECSNNGFRSDCNAGGNDVRLDNLKPAGYEAKLNHAYACVWDTKCSGEGMVFSTQCGSTSTASIPSGHKQSDLKNNKKCESLSKSEVKNLPPKLLN